MARHPRLQRRGSRYFLRVKVPDELRPIIGKREIRKALETSVYSVALDRLRVASVEVDAAFLDARRKLFPGTSLSDAAIHDLVRRWFRERETAAEERYGERPNYLDARDVLESFDIDEAQLAGTTTDGQGEEAVHAATARVLAEGGASVAPGTREWSIAAGLVRRAMLELLRRSRARFLWDFDNGYDPEFAEGTSASTPTTTGTAVTVAALVQRYMGAPERAALSQKTRDGYDTVFRALNELLGATKAVADVSRADCRKIQETLQFLPPMQLSASRTFPWPKQPTRQRRKGCPHSIHPPPIAT